MPGVEDQPPTPEEIATIRQGFKWRYEENGTGTFEDSDIHRFMNEDYYVARFFMHNYDEPGDQCEVASIMAIETFKWRKSMRIKDIKVDKLKDTIKDRGNLYSHNKDKDGKPMLVFAVKNHKRGEEAIEDMKTYFLYYLERIDRETGGDKLTLVFDCAGCGLKNMDMDLIQYMIHVFKSYYPHTLNYILVLEMPWVLNAAWKIIKSWLPAAAVKKIKFLTKSNLNEYVSLDQALVSWGGNDDWEYNFQDEVSTMRDKRAVNGDQGDSAHSNAVSIPGRPKSLQFPIDEELADGSGSRKSVRFNQGEAGTPVSHDSSLASPSPNSRASNLSFADAHSPSTSSSFNAGQINKDILSLNPHIEVVFEVNSASNSLVAKVQITNTSAKTAIFKIKTTSPEKYRVKPSLSYIKTGETINVEIHLHPSQLNETGAVLEPGIDITSVLTAEASASLLKDKFLITAITLDSDSDDQLGHAKITELMKSTTPEVQYRLKCGISGLNKTSSQILRNSGVGDKMPTSSSLQNANKQLETLSKKVNTLQGAVSELQETVVSFKKVTMVLVCAMLLMQLVLLYNISAIGDSSPEASDSDYVSASTPPHPTVTNKEL